MMMQFRLNSMAFARSACVPADWVRHHTNRFTILLARSSRFVLTLLVLVGVSFAAYWVLVA